MLMPVAHAEVKALAVEPACAVTTNATTDDVHYEDAVTCDNALQYSKDIVKLPDAIVMTRAMSAHIAAAYKAPYCAMSLHPDVVHTITANVSHPFTIDCSAQGDVYPPVTSHYASTLGEVMQTDLSSQHAFI